MKKRKQNYSLIIFDIDGTVTTHVSSWQYIHEHLDIWDGKAEQYQNDFRSGKISYRKFCELDAAHWAGLEAEKLRGLFAEMTLARNAKKTIARLRKEGYTLAAVSTGLQFMGERLEKELGFHCVMTNRLNVRSGKLTGGVRINISHNAKESAARKIFKRFGVPASQTIAVGDSDGDIPLLETAGYGIAFNSVSSRLSHIADFDCRTRDFTDILDHILGLETPE